jgi:hypothetical protein
MLSLALGLYFPVARWGCRIAVSGVQVTQDLPFSPQMLASPSGKELNGGEAHPQRTDRTEFPPSQIRRFDFFIDVKKHQSDLFALD